MKGRIKRISAILSALVLLCGCGNAQSSSEAEAVPVAQSVTETAALANTEEDAELPEISGFKGSSDKESFSFKWKAFEGADGYELEMLDQDSGESEKFFISAELTEYVISGKEQGERREFTLRAYRQGGAEKEYTACSKAITLTTMRDSFVIPVSSVCQYAKPALPTGCECTALTTVLRYLGFDITKNEIAEKYLEKIPFTEKKPSKKEKNAEPILIGADPEEAFPGDPAEADGYGCYSKPIAEAANRYLKTQDTGLKAKAVDGKKLSYWYSYVNNGTPVVIWATDSLKASKAIDSWQTADGREITWLTNEHCYVLVGFDEVHGRVMCCNPIDRQVTPVTYSAAAFEKRYNEQGKRAVIIE